MVQNQNPIFSHQENGHFFLANSSDLEPSLTANNSESNPLQQTTTILTKQKLKAAGQFESQKVVDADHGDQISAYVTSSSSELAYKANDVDADKIKTTSSKTLALHSKQELKLDLDLDRQRELSAAATKLSLLLPVNNCTTKPPLVALHSPQTTQNSYTATTTTTTTTENKSKQDEHYNQMFKQKQQQQLMATSQQANQSRSNPINGIIQLPKSTQNFSNNSPENSTRPDYTPQTPALQTKPEQARRFQVANLQQQQQQQTSQDFQWNQPIQQQQSVSSDRNRIGSELSRRLSEYLATTTTKKEPAEKGFKNKLLVAESKDQRKLLANQFKATDFAIQLEPLEPPLARF